MRDKIMVSAFIMLAFAVGMFFGSIITQSRCVYAVVDEDEYNSGVFKVIEDISDEKTSQSN